MKSRKLSVLKTIFLAVLGVVSLAAGYASSTKNVSLTPEIKEVRRPLAAFSDYGGSDLKAADSDISFAINKATRSDVCQSYVYTVMDQGNNSYMLGYYGEGADYKPLTFFYNVTKADGSVEERSTVSTKVSINNIYDGVGAEISGDTFSSNADLYIGKDETVDITSLKFTNIFLAIRPTGVGDYIPDYTNPYFLQKPSIAKAAKTNLIQTDFLSCQLDRVSSFQGFTALECSYQNHSAEMYKTLLPTYADHEEAINKGEEVIRYRFNGLSNSFYIVNYIDGTKFVKQISGTSFLSLKPEQGTVCFFLQGVDANKVASFYLGGGILKIDMVYASTKKDVVSSALSYRFGAVDFAPANGSYKRTDFNTTLIIAAVIYLFAFLGVSIALYFYKKNKYKNDEYLRVNDKLYRKNAITAFFGIGIALMAGLFIYGRAVLLHNSLVVYNPIDAYIIFFSVATIIFIGYYVKFFVTLAKAHHEKVISDRLKLNDTKADDGTVIITKKAGK
ncbi:MAG: hypothetical protein LKJ88_00060 [Bacilli bacterium]|jgi:hypothetical protein|nr:hypothetical protein [Bacilli bacterium]